MNVVMFMDRKLIPSSINTWVSEEYISLKQGIKRGIETSVQWPDIDTGLWDVIFF